MGSLGRISGRPCRAGGKKSLPTSSSDLLPGRWAAAVAAYGALEGPLHGHHFTAQGVSDSKHKGPQAMVGIPGVVISIFCHQVNHLVLIVANIVFIISFKINHS